ncbi:unnamed protein product [Cuscuta campestris]|uniref:CCHC-type domain-containing protein n=1 Tax=Cuscuta campestris TaxID=132261 RepID=A0A484L5I6_9ASTE|nr:unnamed protein product [Cuscuta campestris]
MSDADWAILGRKALGVVRLSLAKSVAFNIVNETTTHGLLKALSNMYEKPSALNKVFLIRQLVNTRMREGASVTIHINQFNSVITRLGSVGIKFDDELQALLLLSSLPDSCSGSEDIRRRSSRDSSSALLSTEGRGRRNKRGSNSGRGKSQSKHREGIVCWDCKQTGHFRSQCPNGKKEVNTTESCSDNSDDVLICSVESSIDSWVMDSGTSVHATPNMKMMKNLKIGDFVGATWTLKNVRVIPSLKRMLISVGQLDDSGLDVKFGGGQWKVVKGNLVVARGKKRVRSQFVLEAMRVIDVSHSELAEKENESRVVTDELKLSGSWELQQAFR